MLDVDGTLAPIVRASGGCGRVAPATRAILEKLVAMPKVYVVLVSGRAASDANAIVRVRGVWTVGNHGFEIVSPNGELETDPDLADQSAAIAQAARELEPIVCQGDRRQAREQAVDAERALSPRRSRCRARRSVRRWSGSRWDCGCA